MPYEHISYFCNYCGQDFDSSSTAESHEEYCEFKPEDEEEIEDKQE